MKQFELLSPAGSVNAFKAAILAGADAIYFGVENFNARARADNILLDKLPTLLPLASSRNIKCYLTLNVLVKDNEFSGLHEIVKKAIDAGIDAVIVQDVGLADFLQKEFPTLELHASTQQTTHNIAQCEFLKTFKYSQVNLSRELSFDELVVLCDYLEKNDIVPEIFVHGAFCISYSGECFFSKVLCDKSANRGECVQPCRREYYSENNKNKLFRPFNLKDNSLYTDVKKLSQLSKNVSLKIEGRIKNESYVWAVTSAWKEQIDSFYNKKNVNIESEKLNKSMNRMFTDGYFNNEISPLMFSDNIKDHSIEKIGIVNYYYADKKELSLFVNKSELLLKVGDKLSLFNEKGDFVTNGFVTKTILFNNSNNNTTCEQCVEFEISGLMSKKILKNQIVYKIPQVISEKTLSEKINNLTVKQIPIKIDVLITDDNYLSCVFYLSEDDFTAAIKSNEKMVPAKTKGLTLDVVKSKLSLLGNTDYVLESVYSECFNENMFLPFTEINNIKRKGVESLNALRMKIQKNNSFTFSGRKVQSDDVNASFLSDFEDQECKNIIDNKKNILLKKKTLFLCSNTETLDFLKNNKFYNSASIVYSLEVPLSDEPILETNIGLYLKNNPDVLPYFSPILFDRDLENCKNFLDSYTGKIIICENTGLSLEAKKRNISIVAGTFFNITNSSSIVSYSLRLNLLGFFSSQELNYTEIKSLSFSDELVCFYPLFSRPFLFQSRNCLTRNLPDKTNNFCKNKICTRSCVLTCEKECNFSSISNIDFVAIKRKGFYSSVYKKDFLNNNFIYKKLKEKIGIWYLDFRLLTFEQVKKFDYEIFGRDVCDELF